MAKHLYNKVDKRILKKELEESTIARTTLSFYKYYHIKNVRFFRNYLYHHFDSVGVLGRIYVSGEGINAQISVPDSQLDAFKKILNDIDFLINLRLNIAIQDDGKSFFKLKIKIREKIVADGLNDKEFDVTNRGKHLSAEEFNKLSSQEDAIVVDMRNHYESEIGHFENAITPDVETFREALPFVEDMLQEDKEKHIIMYCTGGIRCEKASAYYKYKGFKNVYQLEGGIIEYRRQVDNLNLQNKFKGKNFVFDDRMGERISEEIISNCHQCGEPCDVHVNCANDACHILFIQCGNCNDMYQGCCSEKCKSFVNLPESEQQALKKSVEFNGTKFGKGRYKAHHKNDGLSLNNIK